MGQLSSKQAPQRDPIYRRRTLPRRELIKEASTQVKQIKNQLSHKQVSIKEINRFQEILASYSQQLDKFDSLHADIANLQYRLKSINEINRGIQTRKVEAMSKLYQVDKNIHSLKVDLNKDVKILPEVYNSFKLYINDLQNYVKNISEEDQEIVEKKQTMLTEIEASLSLLNRKFEEQNQQNKNVAKEIEKEQLHISGISNFEVKEQIYKVAEELNSAREERINECSDINKIENVFHYLYTDVVKAIKNEDNARVNFGLQSIEDLMRDLQMLNVEAKEKNELQQNMKMFYKTIQDLRDKSDKVENLDADKEEVVEDS